MYNLSPEYEQYHTVSYSDHGKGMPDVCVCLGGKLKLIVRPPIDFTLHSRAHVGRALHAQGCLRLVSCTYVHH